MKVNALPKEGNKFPLYKSISLFLIWSLIVLAFPFAISQAFNLPYSILIPIILGALIFFMICVPTNHIVFDIKIVYILMIQVVIGAIWLTLHGALGYLNLIFQYIVTFFLYCAMLFVNPLTFVKSFRFLVLTMSTLAAIVFVLCIIVKLPYVAEFPNLDGRTNYNFILSFSNTVYDIGGFRLVRPSGYFDEPGSLAFYLVILLIINELVFRDKKTIWIAVLTGLTTLSVAFFLIVIIYFLLIGGRRLFNVLKFLPIVACVFIALYVSLPEDGQTLIGEFTIGRIEGLISDSDGESGYNKGNNRSGLIKTSILAIQDSPIIGQGLSYSSDPTSKFYGKFMGANFFGIFGINGLVGGLFFSLHILYLFYLCFLKYPLFRNMLPKKMFLLYFILIFQRPDYIGGLLTYMSVLMLIFSVSYYYKNSKTENGVI